MKKTLLSFAIVAASALVSCQGQIEPSNQKGGNDGAKVFTASIDNAITRTTLGYSSETATYPVSWASGDEVTINGVTYTVTPDGTDATKATLTKNDSGAADPTGTFNAFYPKGIQSEATAGGTLPASQTYTAGAISNLPMYATTTGTSLTFKNICAVLAVKVTSADIATLKAIKVKSDKAMYGAFTVSEDKAVLTNASDASKAVTLVSSTALTLDATGITFYVAIPAQEYSFLEVYLSSDGTAFTQMMCTKKKDGLGAIAGNAVYTIDYKVNAVQLWSGGPYWATTNIGAETPEAYGQYFAWGYTTGYTHNGSAWTDGSNTKTFNQHKTGFSDYETHTYSDMATANWGTGWSVPTDAQLKTLINDDSSNKCSVAYVTVDVKGIRITGTELGYTSNSIFLPAAGYGHGSSLYDVEYSGGCWSSVQYKNTDAYRLNFYPGYRFSCADNGIKYYGYSVRPVRSSL